jgi:type II secretory pathway pseudopilin PulG
MTMLRRRPGYTLVELFLTIGVLMIVLGLAVNWANRLRQTSLERKTRQQLQRLTAAVSRYQLEHGGRLPDVTPLLDPTLASPNDTATADPPQLRVAASRNGDEVRRALAWPAPADPADDDLIDPWGTPIVLMPQQSPAIGMAPGDRFFFVSAGPDRRFLTRADNLYSYDYAEDTASPPSATRPGVPASNPADAAPDRGGHRE